MRDKKKIFALVLFILMGFFMFTFANPSDGIDELTTPVDETEKDTPKPVVEEKPIQVNNTANQVIAVIDNAPVITVNPKEVKIIRGTDYDVTIGVTIADDKDTNLKPTISMTSTAEAKVGTYTITYTVIDSGNNTSTATRTIKVLEPAADEDKDGYTNKEEYDNDTDFDDVDEYPEYDKSPSITIDEENAFSMEINTTIPNFTATAIDVADGDVDVVITHNIDLTKLGRYTVVFTVTDVLGTETEVTKEFTVVDTKKPKINPEYWRKTVEADKNATFACPTATATDNSNDTITVNYLRNNVDMGKPGDYKCQYSAKDSSGNTAYNDIFITVIDTTKPKINPEYWRKTVKTDKTSTFVCPTATVTDNSRGVITVNYLGNNVDLRTPGEYKCQYSAKDSSGNTAYNDVFITVIPQIYTVVFKDYNDITLKTENVTEDGIYTAPDMTGKTYNDKNITYAFTGWDQTVDKVTQNMTITAIYNVSKANVSLYNFIGVTRPLNGEYSGSMADYTVITTSSQVEIKLTDEVKQIISNGSSRILTYDLTEVLNYIVDTTVLPTPTNAIEDFTKYEWYVLKFEQNNGWHLDGQIVVDTDALNNYRNTAIGTINNYASSFGFDSNLGEITGIVNAAGINGLNTKSAIDAAVVSAKSAIDSLFSSFKLSTKTEIQTAITNNAFKNNYLTQANSIRDTASVNIDNASTISAINSVKNIAITDINNLKALSSNTFDVAVVAGEWGSKNITINNIASDVVITKVSYVYPGIFDTYEVQKYVGSTYLPSINVNEPLILVIKLRIEYTKNGGNYFAKYDVNRSRGTAVSATKYADTYSA
jgi:hypothetical protein